MKSKQRRKRAITKKKRQQKQKQNKAVAKKARRLSRKLAKLPKPPALPVASAPPVAKRRAPTSLRFMPTDLELLEKVRSKYSTLGLLPTLRRALEVALAAEINIAF